MARYLTPVRESDKDGAVWRTINGAHVQFKDGTPIKGPAALMHDALPTHHSLDDIVTHAQQAHAAGKKLYVRYSRGPAADKKGGYVSTNHQTGERHAGLSANNLTSDVLTNDKEHIAHALTEYGYMASQGGAGTRAWLLHGREVGKGADNEPALADIEPVAYVGDGALDEANGLRTAAYERREAERKARIAQAGGTPYDQLKRSGGLGGWGTPRVVTSPKKP